MQNRLVQRMPMVQEIFDRCVVQNRDVIPSTASTRAKSAPTVVSGAKARVRAASSDERWLTFVRQRSRLERRCAINRAAVQDGVLCVQVDVVGRYRRVRQSRLCCALVAQAVCPACWRPRDSCCSTEGSRLALPALRRDNDRVATSQPVQQPVGEPVSTA